MGMTDYQYNCLLNDDNSKKEIKKTDLYKEMSADALSAELLSVVWGLGIAPIFASGVVVSNLATIATLLEDPIYLTLMIPLDILATIGTGALTIYAGAHALERLKLLRTILNRRKELLNNPELSNDESFKLSYKKLINSSYDFDEM